MLLSMTGFGTGVAQLPTKKITVDIKSLNSKQMDMNCRMSSGFRAAEADVRTLVAKVLERGKIDLTVTTEYTGKHSSTRLDLNAIAAYKSQIKEAADMYGIPEPEDWFSVLLKLPDVVTAAEDSDPESVAIQSQALLQAVKEAVDALMEYRRAEGVKLEEFFSVRIENIRSLLGEVNKYERERIEIIRKRLTDSLEKLHGVQFDQGRLEQEMIYYIEKLDINEEKQRLSQHLDYFLETMNRPVPGQGKKLGFIAQEMTREINTLGSKSNHAEMQNLVVRMKDELEQIKEQVLNVM